MERVAQRPPRFCFGAFEFDSRTGELRSKHGQRVLQQQPAEILSALLEHPGELVTREELVRRLWPAGTFVDFERSLNKAVNKLREALEDSAEKPQFIETLPRRGYRFSAPVEIVATQTLPDTGASALRQDDPAGCSRESGRLRAKPPISPERPARAKLVAWLVISVAAAISIRLTSSTLLRKWRSPDPKLQLTKLMDNRDVERVAISPDGRYIVCARREGDGLGLWVRQVAARSSDVEIVPPEVVDFAGLTFSPDGNYVYFVRSNNNTNQPRFHSLFLTPVLGGAPRLLLSNIDSPISFSPDGHQFVYTHGSAHEDAVEVYMANADGSNDHLILTLQGADPVHQSGPAWSHDGRTIALSAMFIDKPVRWALQTISLPSGAVHTLYSSSYKIGRPLWLPTGEGLLVALDDHTNHGQLFTILFPQGEPRRITSDLTDYEDDRLDLSRDGDTAAIIAWDQVGNIWEAPAFDLTKAKQVESSALALFHVAPATDGKILVTGLDNQLWIMNADGSQRRLFTDVHPASAPFACGRFVLFSSREHPG